MTTLTTAPPAIVDEEQTFDASIYDLPVPRLDGFKASKLDIRFSGNAPLDRTSADDLELLEAARLGREIRLIVVAEACGKGFKLNRKPNDEEELSFSATLRVISVEAAEVV